MITVVFSVCVAIKDYLCTCVHVCVGTDSHLRKLEVDIRCLPLSFATLFFWQGLSLNLEIIAQLDWLIYELHGFSYLYFSCTG